MAHRHGNSRLPNVSAAETLFDRVTLNLAAAADAGLEIEEVQAVLIGVAPVIGTARTMAAAGNTLRALGLAAAAADEDD